MPFGIFVVEKFLTIKSLSLSNRSNLVIFCHQKIAQYSAFTHLSRFNLSALPCAYKSFSLFASVEVLNVCQSILYYVSQPPSLLVRKKKEKYAPLVGACKLYNPMSLLAKKISGLNERIHQQAPLNKNSGSLKRIDVMDEMASNITSIIISHAERLRKWGSP